jgi:hypothetical protein
MKIGNIFFVVYVVVVTAAGLFVVEILSRKINLANGIDIPSFVGARSPKNAAVGDRETKSVIDAHLGFARGKEEPKVRALQAKYTWIDGFVIYSKKDLTR